MSLFMSRITLNDEPSAGSLYHLLSDRLGAYEAHRLVWTLFGDGAERDRDFLYRQDWQQGRPLFTIVSRRPPEDRHNLFRIETKDYAPDLRAGDRLAFMARLNPVVWKRDTKKGRKVDVVMDEVQRRKAGGEEHPDRLEAARAVLPGWLAERGARHGFALQADSLVMDGYDRHTFRSRKGHEVQVAGLDVQGSLTVEDPEAFVGMLGNGLGSARAFGFGLVLVRRRG